MAGVDPEQKTLRELWWLAHGAWQPTTHLLALTANLKRDPKKYPRPFQPRNFHPLEPAGPGSGRGLPLHAGTLRILKAALVDPRGERKIS